jgi:taurine dioxygenase|tara:strand:+ start:917 stop:1768 length:852 start_codon:yes stop_codon:yes gene_type:complete
VKYEKINTKSELGAEIHDFKIENHYSSKFIKEIRNLWLEHSVLIFKNLQLNHYQFERLSLLFGEFGDDPYIESLESHPNIIEVKRDADEKAPPFGGSWHSDWSFQENPPSATLLHSKIIPPIGGETLFLNTHKAYEDLSISIKEKINNLKVIHSAARPYADDGFYALEKNKDRSMKIKPSKKAKDIILHPLVRTHPETRRKSLFINPVYTIAIDGLSEDESKSLLNELFNHMENEIYIYKHSWEPNMLVMWDNRSVNHCAQGGYEGHERLLHRITLSGDRPFG